MIIDNENLLVDRFKDVLQYLINGYTSAIDIGCGNCGPTKDLRIYKMVHTDIDLPDGLDPNKYIKGPAQEVIEQNYGRFDVSLALDFLEHLTKDEGIELVKTLWDVGVKRQIFFIPTGDEEKVLSPEVNPGHKTLWLPDEFEWWGFEVWHCPNFHPTLGIGAFLAWKTKGSETTKERDVYNDAIS